MNLHSSEMSKKDYRKKEMGKKERGKEEREKGRKKGRYIKIYGNFNHNKYEYKVKCLSHFKNE